MKKTQLKIIIGCIGLYLIIIPTITLAFGVGTAGPMYNPETGKLVEVSVGATVGAVSTMVKDYVLGKIGDTVIEVMGWIATTAVWLVSWILWIANEIFNVSVNAGIREFHKFAKLDAVKNAWTLMRDIVNLTLVFALIYAAMAIILDLKNADGKRIVTNVIMVALLVNFSAFFTHIVIDASNVVANQFYTEAAKDPKTKKETTTLTGAPDVSSRFVQSFMTFDESSKTDQPKEFTNKKSSSVFALIGVSVMQIILILITSLVLFAGAVLFFTRTIKLLFVIIFSPIAFLGFALSGMLKSVSDMWKKTLINEAIFAPAFLFMLLITIKFVNSAPTNKNKLPESIFNVGIKEYVEQLAGVSLHFALSIGFIIGALIIAKQLGATGVAVAGNLGGRMTGGMVGLGRRAGVRIGRGADKLTGNRLSAAGGRVSGALGSLKTGIGASRVGTATTAIKEEFGLVGTGSKLRDAVRSPLKTASEQIAQVTKGYGVEAGFMGQTKDQEKELAKLRKEEREATERADQKKNEADIQTALRMPKPEDKDKALKETTKRLSDNHLKEMDVNIVMQIAHKLSGGQMKTVMGRGGLTGTEKGKIKDAHLAPIKAKMEEWEKANELDNGPEKDAKLEEITTALREMINKDRNPEEAAALGKDTLSNQAVSRVLTPQVLQKAMPSMPIEAQRAIRDQMEAEIAAGTATAEQEMIKEWTELDFIGRYFGVKKSSPTPTTSTETPPATPPRSEML